MSETETNEEIPDFDIPQTLSPTKYATRRQRETLDRFMSCIVPAMGIFMDAKIVTGSMLPAAQANEQILNGMLALATFHDLPMAADMRAASMVPTRRYERYQTALQWYQNSVKQSSQSPLDHQSAQSVVVSLLAIIIYMGIELRQMNRQNRQSLLVIAYEIVYAARLTIRKSRNLTLLQCLCSLMDFTVLGAADPSCVEARHFREMCSVVKQLCSNCNATQNYVLRANLYDIMYDVNTIVDHGRGNEFELECRMQSWCQQLSIYERSLPMDFSARIPALRCRFLFGQLQVVWETFLHSPNINIKNIESRLSQVLAIHEINYNNIQITRAKGIPLLSSWVLETMVIPPCVWVAWYWRSSAAYTRIRGIFADYQQQNQPEQMRFIRVVLDFMEELISTPHQEPTHLELELLQRKPKVLQLYRAYHYVEYLLQKSGISHNSHTSLPSQPQSRAHSPDYLD